MNRTRALVALAGAACVAAGMYAFAHVRYAGEIADGYTVWDVVARDVVVCFVLVLVALATPLWRGVRLLWMLAGLWWVWLLVLPPVDTSDSPERGVAFLSRFPYWSGVALPLFLLTLAHWAAGRRAGRAFQTPTAVLVAWAGALAVCARYEGINSDYRWAGVDYQRMDLLGWILLAAPPLLVVGWTLRCDRQAFPERTQVERAVWDRVAPWLRSPRAAVLMGTAAVALGLEAINLYYDYGGWSGMGTALVGGLLAGPWLGLALHRHAAPHPSPTV